MKLAVLKVEGTAALGRGDAARPLREGETLDPGAWLELAEGGRVLVQDAAGRTRWITVSGPVEIPSVPATEEETGRSFREQESHGFFQVARHREEVAPLDFSYTDNRQLTHEVNRPLAGRGTYDPRVEERIDPLAFRLDGRIEEPRWLRGRAGPDHDGTTAERTPLALLFRDDSAPPPPPPAILPGSGVAGRSLAERVSEDGVLDGHFLLSAPGGIGRLLVNGVELSPARLSQLAASPLELPVTYGTLRLTGYDPATGRVDYRYIPDPQDHSAGDPLESVALELVEADGDRVSATLEIRVTDTAPVAVDDGVGGLREDQAPFVRTFDVLANDRLNVDVPAGTPPAWVSAVEGDAGRVGVAVSGTYGTLVLNADGSATYTLDNAGAAVQGLADGQVVTDRFSYTVTDADGDRSTAFVTVTITGTSDAPALSGPVNRDYEEDAPPVGVLDPAFTITGGGNLTGAVLTFTNALPEDQVTLGALPAGITGTVDTSVPGQVRVVLTGTASTADYEAALEAIRYANSSQTPVEGARNYTIVVTDAAGDTVSFAGTVTVDATPDPVDNSVQVTEGDPAIDQAHDDGNPATTEGNLLANDDGGTPGAAITGFTYVDEAGNLQNGMVGVAVDTRHGTFLLNADGTWEYTPDSAEDQSSPTVDHIVYTVTDGNGDTATARFDIEVTDRPMQVAPDDATVREADLQGLTGAPGTDSDSRSLNLDTGGDALQDVVFTGITDGDHSGLTSAGAPVYYYLDAAGHRLTASTATSEGAVDPSNTVFTVELTGTSGPNPGYQVTLHQPVDHPSGGGANSLSRTFSFRATDTDSSITGSFDVTIVDDVPQAGTLNLSGPEDQSLRFHLMEGGGTVRIDGNPLPVGNTVNVREGSDVVGTLTNEGNGDFTFTPATHYSGTPSFAYSITDQDGDTATGTVNLTVTPVSDAPGLGVTVAAMATPEDTAVDLGLRAPTVTDATDRTAGGADYPERLGAITLSGFRPGSRLLDASGNTLFTATAGDTDVTIQLSDGAPHISGLATDLTLTVAGFEGLRMLPAPHDHQNPVIGYSVVEHEVDAAGNPLDAGAAASTTVIVDVRAVTDPVDLKLDGNDHPAGTPYSATLAEDTSLDLDALLSATFADLDGSENRQIVIANPAGNGTIRVNGTDVAGGDSITIPAPGLSTGTTGFPNIDLAAAANLSGNFNGIEIRLEAKDSDSDSPSAAPVTESDSVYLDLTVTNVAGDVEGTDASTPEDTSLALSSLVRLTDTDGSETIDSVTVKALAAGWKVLDTSGNTVFTGDGTSDYTVPGGDLGYRLLPPAHSSADAVVTFEVQSTDGTDTRTVTVNPKVTVTPVAEVIGPVPGAGDTDGDGAADLAMNGDFTYATAGREDTWFALSTDGFDFPGPWSNQDSDEQTFALLTPVLSGGSATGSQFRYTDAGGTVHTLTYVGSPVAVPVAHLGSVEFRPAENVAGTFEIRVQARTVDTDPDTGATVTADSGSAVLTNLVVEPVADPVTLAVASPLVVDEDTDKALDIRPTSADRDGSETFDVTIRQIPAGATLVYNGTTLTPVGGEVTITDFDSTLPLTIRPPAHSNDDFTLKVSAVAKDGADTSPASQELDIRIQVRGVADSPVVTTATATAAEGDLDSGADTLTLAELITGLGNPDTDGSQQQTVLVTGLDAAFSLEGSAVSFLGGTGTGRIWEVAPADLANAVLRVPDNYSGTVTFGGKVVVTENDGHSTQQDLGTLRAEVTPTPEATLNLSTTLSEDRLGQVDFSIVHANGDTDETLASVWISEADLTGAPYTLYLGNGTGTPLLSANGQPGVEISGGWVKLTGGAIGDIYALGGADLHGSYSFAVRYEIRDAAADGTLAPVTTQSADTAYTLEVRAVTDPVAAALGTLSATHGTVSGTTVTVDRNDTVTVPVTFTQVDDAAEGSNGADLDGSERLLRIEISGVPEGVTVQGAVYAGDDPAGNHSGRWTIDLADPAFDNAAGITENLVFEIDGTAAQLAGVHATITITGVSRDAGTGAEQTASQSWTLSVDPVFDDSGANGTPPPGIDHVLQKPGVTVLEDQPVTLLDLLDAQITGSGNFSIRLEYLPPGTTVTGMREIAPGIWSASGSGDDAALQTLLAGITVTPPENFNDNHSGPLTFDATLTTYSSSGNRQDSHVAVSQSITPVSDPVEMSVTAPAGSEDNDLNFTVNLSNPADLGAASLIGGNLYIQLDESGLTGASGTLLHGGTPLAVQSVTGVPGIPDGNYYVVSGVAPTDTVALTYRPGAHASGSVNLTARVAGQESGAANVVGSSASATLEIAPVTDGVPVTAADATGNEDQPVPLSLSLGTPPDSDGSETLLSAVLNKLPNGFVVLAGADAASAQVATNLGDDGTGHNSWLIPLSGGALPAYVAVQPPPQWSGTVTGVEFQVQVSDSGQAPVASSDTFDLAVTPVADPATINPTLSFGTEGQIVPLNLNASLQDADGSETAVVTLQGIGPHAAFYGAGNTLLTGVAYDSGTDTYTLSGLTVADVNNLGVLQSARTATVNVSLHTVDGTDTSAPVTGSFDLEIGPALATTGDDTLLYSGNPLDGLAGVDTVILRLGEDLDFSTPAPAADLDNIEVIDLGVGDHALAGLELQDVLDVTDAGNTLKLLGGAGDSVELVNGAGGSWSSSGTVTEGGHTFDVYVHSADPSVTLKIETGITETIV